MSLRRSQEEMEDKMIRDILENFDFKKCRRVMKYLKWVWAFENETPSIDRLKESATNCLKHAIEIAKKGKSSKATYFASTGGLKGNAWVNRFGYIEAIRLEFVLTDWDSDGDY